MPALRRPDPSRGPHGLRGGQASPGSAQPDSIPMHAIVQGVSRFHCDVFPGQEALYSRLVADGQQPKALVISCADSRVVPELITQCGPGELFVCRNAGNIVPPLADSQGGVSATIEYAVAVLGVRDVIVCGHSDCGAMKGLLDPAPLDGVPAVKSWLCHCHAALGVFRAAYPDDLDPAAAAAALARENVIAQLTHLRTHPSVAARLATGQLRLHGWFFDLASGTVFALDGPGTTFLPVEENGPLPVATGAVAPQAVRVAPGRVQPPPVQSRGHALARVAAT